MSKLPGRIVIDGEFCGGRPDFQGMRIPVYVVLEMLLNEEPKSEIVKSFPDLKEDDLKAALAYATEIAAIPRQTLLKAG